MMGKQQSAQAISKPPLLWSFHFEDFLKLGDLKVMWSPHFRWQHCHFPKPFKQTHQRQVSSIPSKQDVKLRRTCSIMAIDRKRSRKIVWGRQPTNNSLSQNRCEFVGSRMWSHRATLRAFLNSMDNNHNGDSKHSQLIRPKIPKIVKTRSELNFSTHSFKSKHSPKTTHQTGPTSSITDPDGEVPRPVWSYVFCWTVNVPHVYHRFSLTTYCINQMRS